MSASTIAEGPEPFDSRDSAAHANLDRDSRLNVSQKPYLTGVILTLGSILTFFSALISAYIVRRGSTNEDWKHFATPHLLWTNTAILIASSTALLYARRRFLANDPAGFRRWCGAALILGFFFAAGQALAWRELAAAGTLLNSDPGASFYYLITAGHVACVCGGLIALLSIIIRAKQRGLSRSVVSSISTYWHSVVGLWIFLFLLLVFGP